MLILLPPSEGKTAPASGAPVDLAVLSHPALEAHRRRVGDALAKVSGQRNAMEALGVGASLHQEVERNRTVWDNPAAASSTVYTGVLYDAAGMADWDAATLDKARESVRIVSALWGAVSPADRIPAYRLSMGTSLGRLGGLATYWKKHLPAELDALADGGLVIDCRSASYVAAYRPAESPWVAVSVQRELNGKRAVVSHMAKHTRGLLAAHLVRDDARPETAADLADAAAGMIGDALVDVTLTAKAKGPDELTLVIAG
ncbi:peroxide stress protein YaaA [Demequina sp. SYSU T00192]|uniref:Peroxide stress protein YaaA n=1 Tax=Demequina litoralis TaxID=3051660 RepID=A0ABT8GCZ3_9MICO|nr:peroxide stress protein YaaA [Demequina sp. SYSU T00192]MDN4476859.1 peroxide stress protein YaaA [Demequina sp. SYSU T00192]